MAEKMFGFIPLTPQLITKFDKFMQDKESTEFFLIGRAGVGKTSNARDIVQYLEHKNLTYQVTAFTHKAKGVLKEKLDSPHVSTLYSFLKKAPTINSDATAKDFLRVVNQFGTPDTIKVLIVDEFSMVSSKDIDTILEMVESTNYCYRCNTCGYIVDYHKVDPLDDIDWDKCPSCATERALEEEPNDSIPTKVVFIGDPSQLNPVGGIGIKPRGDYIHRLTTDYRTDANSDLNKFSNYLADKVDNDEPITYEDFENFINGKDIVKVDSLAQAYKETAGTKKVLAWTNKLVQALNKSIAGIELPAEGDIIAIANIKGITTAKVINIIPYQGIKYTDKVYTPNSIIDKETKFNPLKTLDEMGSVFINTDEGIIATMFGHFNYKSMQAKYDKALITANNNSGKGSKDSRQAYKQLMTFTNHITNSDFIHATTVNKSQGSQWESVFISVSDIMKCINKDDRNRLLSVAVSRAERKVFLRW